ncbi:MAG: hypothetical protein ABII21_00665, partial [bacterium]
MYIRLTTQSRLAEGGVEGEEDGDGETDADGVADPQATTNVVSHTSTAGVTSKTGAGTAEGSGVGEGRVATVVGLLTIYTTPTPSTAVKKIPRPISSIFFVFAVMVLLLSTWDHKLIHHLAWRTLGTVL